MSGVLLDVYLEMQPGVSVCVHACVHLCVCFKDTDLPGRPRCENDTDWCSANKHLCVLAVLASPSELTAEELNCLDEMTHARISPTDESQNPHVSLLRAQSVCSAINHDQSYFSTCIALTF